jgi:hypothetical protein
MPYHAILCHIMPYYAISCHIMPYYAIIYHNIPYIYTYHKHIIWVGIYYHYLSKRFWAHWIPSPLVLLNYRWGSSPSNRRSSNPGWARSTSAWWDLVNSDTSTVQYHLNILKPINGSTMDKFCSLSLVSALVSSPWVKNAVPSGNFT